MALPKPPKEIMEEGMDSGSPMDSAVGAAMPPAGDSPEGATGSRGLIVINLQDYPELQGMPIGETIGLRLEQLDDSTGDLSFSIVAPQ